MLFCNHVRYDYLYYVLIFIWKRNLQKNMYVENFAFMKIVNVC